MDRSPRRDQIAVTHPDSRTVERGKPSILSVSRTVNTWNCDTRQLVQAMNAAFALIISDPDIKDDEDRAFDLSRGLIVDALDHSAASASEAIDKALELELQDVDGRSEKLPILLVCAAIRSMTDAAARWLRSIDPQPGATKGLRVTPGINILDIQMVEVHYAIGARPFEKGDPFLRALKDRIDAVIEAYVGPIYLLGSAPQKWFDNALTNIHEFVMSDDPGGAAIRNCLAIDTGGETSLKMIGSLRSIETVLRNWIDPMQYEETQREEAWQDCRESLLTLPDASETMFNETFGVRSVFQPPIISYHVNGRGSRAETRPETIEDIGRLIGGLLSTRVSGEDLIILSGGPGSGKSTLCRVLASKLAAIKDMHPIFLRLRKVKEGVDITSFIEESLKNIGLIDRISDLRSVPNLVLILDGFDELAMSSKARLRQLFNVLRDELSTGPLRRAKIIVSGRDTLFPGGDGLPLGSHVLNLQPFDENRVKSWGALWRREHKNGAGGSFRPELLLVSGHRAKAAHPLTHLVMWPLTLHLLAQIHTAGRLQIGDSGQDIERAYLYRAILAETAARQEQQTAGSDAARLSSPRMREFLRALAWEMYLRSVDSIDAADVTPLLSSFYPDVRETELSDLAEVAIVNSPELTRGEETGFEFVHKSFSEYLVAEQIALIVEYVIFKAPEFGTSETTWRMSEGEAAVALAPAIALRPLTSEVQEMLEPMLGVMASFSASDRVDNDVPTTVRNEGLLRLIDRFERLYIAAVGGEPITAIGAKARAAFLAPGPLEAYANYCLGLLLLGSAAARRVELDGGSALFSCDPQPGMFWRFVSIVQLGGISISAPLAERLFIGASVQRAGQEALRDVDFPVSFVGFEKLAGYEGTVSRAAISAAVENMVLLLLSSVVMVEPSSRNSMEENREIVPGPPRVASHLAVGGRDLADLMRTMLDRRRSPFLALLEALSRLDLVHPGTLSAFQNASEHILMELRRRRWDGEEFSYLSMRLMDDVLSLIRHPEPFGMGDRNFDLVRDVMMLVERVARRGRPRP
jgi:hypothetical protein